MTDLLWLWLASYLLLAGLRHAAGTVMRHAAGRAMPAPVGHPHETDPMGVAQ